MTEMRITWRWLFVFAALGVFIGLMLGLITGWIIIPLGNTSVDVSALNAGAQNDYITLVANSFAFDNDLPHAKQRLDLLKDSNLKARVEKLAKALATRQDANAANVADLAVALGSTDSSLKVLAASVANSPGSAPTKYAQLDEPPTTTPRPTQAATDAPTPTEKIPPTTAPTKSTQAAAPKNTPKPAAPANPPAAAPLSPVWKPSYPDQWWSGVKFVPATVTSGQQYWRLISATFCDVPPAGAPSDTDTCPGMPGGPMDHTIYIGVLDQNGNCAQNAKVNHLTNTGDTTPAEQKTAIYPWNKCNIDFEWNMYGEGNDIWVDGLPSDRLNGMVMNSPQLNWSSNKAHVRYFLVFQLTTR